MLKVYDGYDDSADLIELNSETPSITSKTRTLYITSTGGAFNFTYNMIPKAATENNTSSCENKAVSIPDIGNIVLKSPNYPKPYNNNIDCSWQIAPANREYHAELKFNALDLEEIGTCIDFVEISQSKDLQTWTNTTQICKKEANSSPRFIGNPYLKLRFRTDGDIGKKGYEAVASSVCGSSMYGSFGSINITNMMTNRYLLDCSWQFNVQYGRRIQISFSDIKIQNNINCYSYIVLKNGIFENSPNLGIGRLCKNEDFVTIPPSSSHSITLKMRATRGVFQRGVISFTEVLSECSKTIQLLGDEEQEISTPNWPNIPNPKTECVWNIVAPPHTLISIDFKGKIDMSGSCDKEYVEIKDGATDRARSLGKLCSKEQANTIYSTGNRMRVVYFNDISEPKPGFSAKVKLGLCGGTYGGSEGIINFPENHDVWTPTTDNVTCEYFINPSQYKSLNVSIDLSKFGDALDDNCELNHIEIFNMNSDGIYEPYSTPKICYGNGVPLNMLLASRTMLRVILYKKNRQQSQFKLTYNNVDGCQQELVATEGVIRTPGYPIHSRRIMNCFYKIRVPKGSRIKLEILDFNLPQNVLKRIAIYNDWQRRSINHEFLANDTVDNTFYSTDNVMSIVIFVLNRDKITFRGLKMKFSSNEESSMCSNMIGMQGALNVNVTAFGNQSYYCEYKFDLDVNRTLALKFSNIDIISETHSALSIFNGATVCDEKYLTDTPLYFSIENDKNIGFCESVNDTKSYRLTNGGILKAQNKRLFTYLKSFNVAYKSHPCGGIINVGKL